jgi:hypothetical protein
MKTNRKISVLLAGLAGGYMQKSEIESNDPPPPKIPMTNPQTRQKHGAQGSPGNGRSAAILAVLACLMAGRATAGTLTVSSGPISNPPNLSAEGDLDWAHWGSFNNTDYDHKAGVTPQIGNFTLIGGAGIGQYSGAAASCSWVDGTVDQMVAGLATGVYAYPLGAGYQWTIPASTTPRVLHLYVSTSATSGELDFTLSDGSAPSVTNIVAGGAAARLTVTFAANSASQTLTVNYVMASPGQSGGNVALMAASLSSAASLPLSVPQPQLSGGSALKAGSTFTVLANPLGVDINGATAFAYQWQVSYNGGSYVDIAGGTNDLLNATAGSAGNYNYQVVVTNSVLGGAAVTSAPVALAVTTPTSTLGASGAVLPAAAPPAFTPLDIDLTSEGIIDWGHWGYFNLTDYDYKNGTIGNFTQIGAGAFGPFVSSVSFSWTDATTADNPVTATTSGVGLPVDNGFELDIPAATTNRLVYVYVGLNNAYLNFTASLSDNSGPLFTDNPATTMGTLRYSILFGAATTGQTLKVRLTETARVADGGSISLLSASLQPVPPLSVSALVVNPGTSVLVNQPVVVSVAPLQPQGAPPFTYQWQRNTGSGFTNIPNATGTSVSFLAAGTVGSESFQVIITNSQGSITSAPVVLTQTAPTGLLRLLDREIWSVANLTQEGGLDWSHWGASGTSAAFDQKATGGSLIGNYTELGTQTIYTFGNTLGSFTWTDGTPTAVSTNTSGVYVNNTDQGFSLNIAAAQTNRMLHVYVGSYQANTHIQASLSDNSAIPVIDETLPFGGTAKYNLEFAAGSPGQTLTFQIWNTTATPGYDGNVTLMAAALEGIPALAVGTSTIAPTNIVAVGSTVQLQVQGANGLQPLHYQWLVNTGNGYAAIPNSDTANFFRPASTVGSESYEVVVSDTSGSVTSAPITLTVTRATSTLSGSSASVDLSGAQIIAQIIDLTAEGLIDWAQWGNGGVISGYEQKYPLANQISNFSIIGTGPLNPYGGNGVHCTWTDGTPDATGDTQQGIYINSAPNGFELTSEAASYERVLNVYCALWEATMHVEATMSDNSAPIFVDESFSNSATAAARCYSFRYSSPTPGSYLIVKWWDAAGGNVTINAATLTYGPNNLQVKPVSGGQVQVTWPLGTLLEAPAVTGPWTTNNATSPYTFTPTGTQKYFRAIIN